MKKSQIVARRAAAYTAGLGLAASALVAGSGAANADAIVDITGVVTNAAGAPLVDADVTAFVQNGNQLYPVDGGSTDATGRYSLTELDPATLAARYTGTSPAETAVRAAKSFKLFFTKSIPDAELHSNPGYLARAYGGTKSLTNGTAVPVNGTTATTANQALPTAAGMIVRITGATGAPVTAGGNVDLFEAGSDNPLDANRTTPTGGTFDDDDFYDNPATQAVEPAPVDGLVYVYGIEPGTYAINAGGADADATTGAFRSYLSRFIGGDGTYAKAAPVTATAGSFASTGVQLTDVLSATEAPRITGNSSFGSTLKATPGTWLRQQGTEFTYQWTRNGVPVAGATTPTYKVTKADKKKKVGVTVKAVATETDFGGLPFDFTGTASAAPTSKVGEKSKVKAKRSGDGFAVTVSVAKKKLAKKLGTPKGKIVLYTVDGDVASKKVKLKNGKATITPKSKFASEKKFIVTYLGGGKLGSDTANAKLGGGGKKK